MWTLTGLEPLDNSGPKQFLTIPCQGLIGTIVFTPKYHKHSRDTLLEMDCPYNELHKLLSSRVLGVHGVLHLKDHQDPNRPKNFGRESYFLYSYIDIGLAEFLFKKNTTTPKFAYCFCLYQYVYISLQYLFRLKTVHNIVFHPSNRISLAICFFLFCFLVPDDENTHFSNVFFFN